ncbi:MAG: hypothetical protein IJC25_06510, partial [Clostridia bacterium]|nr:hypothetical protein [Clostridia bacterium]
MKRFAALWLCFVLLLTGMPIGEHAHDGHAHAEENCTHENSEQTGGHPENQTIVRIDDTKHLREFDVYWDYKCLDCGETYSKLVDHGYEAEEHAFLVDPNLTVCNQCGMQKPCTAHSYGDNGVCTVCGHCPHSTYTVGNTNTQTWEPEQYDEQFHSEYNIFAAEATCKTCGVLFMKYNEYTVYKAHTYVDGVCACGAEGETTTCAHTSVDYRNHESNIVYSDITADQHTIISDYYSYQWCLDCDSCVYYEYQEDLTRTQKHTYVNGVCACGAEQQITDCTHSWQSWDGICSICRALCPHEVTHVSEYSTHFYGGVDNGDGTHTGRVQRYTAKVCEACDYKETVEILSDGQEVSEHMFRDGVCSICGATSACTHEETETSLAYYSMHYELVDADYHLETYFVANRTVCLNEACRQELAFEPTGEKVSLRKIHTFADGVCTACGQETEGCMHPSLEKQGYFYELVSGEWTDNGNGTHDGMAARSRYMYCASCGTTLVEQVDFPRIRTDNHDYDENGVCKGCGYGAPSSCEHNWVADEYPYESDRREFTKVDDETHTYVYDLKNRLVCSVCSEVKWELVEGQQNVTGTDFHTFYYDKTLTECLDCGAKKPADDCTEHDWSNQDGVCKVCGAACGHEWQDSVCTVCGMACGHEWQDGACTVCGAVCGHEWQDGACTVCGTACGHEWQDGACTVCGTACGHENSTKGDHGTWENAVY